MEKYPLHWPVGYSRTKYRVYSQFKQSMDKAQRFLRDEIDRLGATNLIVSSNIPIRADGGMHASFMDRILEDPGVAIYFDLRGKKVSMCCDKYRTVWENVYALGKGIEALRGMERWGVSDFIERAFTGFTALPPRQDLLVKRDWWTVLNYPQKPGNGPWDWAGVEAQYKSLAKRLHPDVGGSVEAFQELTTAFTEAKTEYGK